MSGIHHIGTKLWEREFGFTQAELLQDILTMRGEG